MTRAALAERRREASEVGNGRVGLSDAPEVVALVARVATNADPFAFAELYDRFFPAVYGYLYRRVANSTIAEDLTQEVFVRAWFGMKQFQWQGRPLLSWLYRVAHNAHADYVRRPHLLLRLEPSRERQLALDPPIEAYLERVVNVDLLRRAVRQLTPDQQVLIRLRFEEGLATAEIARAMRKREGAIRGLQFRALQRLREILVAADDLDAVGLRRLSPSSSE